MDFYLLGGVRVVSDGVDVPLGGPRQRRLLAVLLLGEGRVVGIDRIVEAVWGDGVPPVGATRTVQSYASRLRTALGDGFVSPRAEGYGLDRRDVTVDAERFVAGVRAAAMEPPAAAVRLLDEALGLWHGRAFGEFADEEWCRPAVVRLEEVRVVALETRVQASLDLGAHVEVVPELERLVAEHPLRDRFWAQLMVALFRSGRQADALRAFHRHRGVLADEVGLDPSRELVELERRIAVADPSLAFVTVGRSVRGYVLTEVIGEGEFGAVYRAVQPGVGRDVAVKVVRPELADDPGYVRRFEGEARLVARLEHPHIVPLYDFWREPGAAYLVFRFTRGGTVADDARDGSRWSLGRVNRLVEEIGDALVAAHAAGVVHGDVSSANVLLDEQGNAYLSDFGIAVGAGRLPPTGSNPTTGASHYPDAPFDATATPESDQYALAVMVHELLVGLRPRSDESAEPGEGSVGTPAVERRWRVPAAVEAVLGRAMSTAPDDRFGSIAAFLTAWRAAVADVDATNVSSITQDGASGRPGTLGNVLLANPYKGLRAFDAGDAQDFHGRAESLERLVALVSERRFVVVVGASGSGKSSLVRAGLLPRMRREGRLAVVAVPGGQPSEEVAEALAQIAVRHRRGLVAALLDPALIGPAIASVLPAGVDDVVLVLDQFEELWTMANPVVRDRFLDALVAATMSADSRVRVVATVRADLYDRPLSHPVLGALVEAGSFSLAPLGPAELEQVMSAPAARVGATLEPGLAAALVADFVAQPAGLPLLQYALTELFDHRDGLTMTLAAYRSMGGLEGGLTSRAETVIGELPDAGRVAARQLFTRLVTPGEGSEDTRRRARRAELTSVGSSVIEAFGAARLVTFDVDPFDRAPTVEVAHEALIRHWPRLRGWVDEDRESLRLRGHLADAAGGWAARGRDDGDLYRGARLGTVEEWAADNADDLTPVERAFLHESSRGARRTRRAARAALAALGTLLVAALAAAGVAVVQRQRADTNATAAARNADTATRNAQTAAESATAADVARRRSDLRRLAFQAHATASSQPDLAMLLAVEAYRRQPDAASEDALFAALATQPAIRRYVDVGLPDEAVVGEMAASTSLVALALDDDTIVLLDAASLQPTGVSITLDARAHLAFSPSGNELVTVTHNGDIARWDPRTGREVAPRVRVAPAEAANPSGPPVAYLPDDSLAVVDGSAVAVVPPGAAAPTRRAVLTGGSTISALAVLPSGGTLAVAWSPNAALDSGAVALVTVADLATRWLINLDGGPSALVAAGDESLLAALATNTLGGRIVSIDVSTGALDDRTGDLPSIGTALLALDDGGALVTLYTGGVARVRPDGSVLPRVELRTVTPLVRLANGTVLGASGDRLIEIDPDQHSVIGRTLRAGNRTITGLLAGARGRILVIDAADEAMTVLDTTTLTPIGPPVRPTIPLTALATVTMSPTGTHVAATNYQHVEILDVATGQPLGAPIEIGTADVAVFSPDGTRLLVAGLDSRVHQIDVATQQTRWSRDFGGIPNAPGWSPSGRFIAVRTITGEVRVLDADSGTDVSGPFAGVTALTFPPDDEQVLALGDELRVLETRTGRVIRTLPGNGGLFGAGFVRNGRWIAGITGSGLFELVDAATGDRVGVPLRVTDDAYSTAAAAFLTDNGIYHGPLGGPVVYYDVDPENWHTLACQAAGRNLTRAEWAELLGSLGPYRVTCPQYQTA